MISFQNLREIIGRQKSLLSCPRATLTYLTHFFSLLPEKEESGKGKLGHILAFHSLSFPLFLFFPKFFYFALPFTSVSSHLLFALFFFF